MKRLMFGIPAMLLTLWYLTGCSRGIDVGFHIAPVSAIENHQGFQAPDVIEATARAKKEKY